MWTNNFKNNHDFMFWESFFKFWDKALGCTLTFFFRFVDYHVKGNLSDKLRRYNTIHTISNRLFMFWKRKCKSIAHFFYHLDQQRNHGQVVIGQSPILSNVRSSNFGKGHNIIYKVHVGPSSQHPQSHTQRHLVLVQSWLRNAHTL